MNTQDKIIGIFGHKGAGKMSIGWLLANVLERRLEGRELSVAEFQELCTKIRTDQMAAHMSEFRNVYLTEFQESLIVYASMFLGESADNLMDPSWTHSHWVLLERCKVTDSLPREATVYTHEDLAVKRCQAMSQMLSGFRPQPWGENDYSTVADWIMYLAYWTMQGMMGPSFWLNDQKNYDDMYGSRQEPTIYMDVKTREELEYIRSRGGILIKATCPERETQDRLTRSQGLWDHYQFVVVTDSNGLEGTYSQINDIASQLIDLWRAQEKESAEP